MKHDQQELHDTLARLAEPSLPPGLDARIWATRQRRVRRSFGIAGIATAGVLLATALVLQPRPGTDSPAATDVAQAVPAMPRTDDVMADIRAIDHVLQLAYTRNASEDEVAPLWKARRELLLRLQVPPTASGFI